MTLLSTKVLVCWERTLSDDEKNTLAVLMRLANYQQMVVSAKVKFGKIKHWRLLNINGDIVHNKITMNELQTILLERPYYEH